MLIDWGDVSCGWLCYFDTFVGLIACGFNRAKTVGIWGVPAGGGGSVGRSFLLERGAEGGHERPEAGEGAGHDTIVQLDLSPDSHICAK